jgi:hypothetical protein
LYIVPECVFDLILILETMSPSLLRNGIPHIQKNTWH